MDFDDDCGYEYDEGSDLDNWEDEQVFQDGVAEAYGEEREEFTADEEYDEDEDASDDPCDDCGGPMDDSCMGCGEYARKASLMDPSGVYNSAGECIGRITPLRHYL